MSSTPRPLVAGNWKMNGLSASLCEIEAIAARYDAALREAVELAICPPGDSAGRRAARIVARAEIALGGQDCHAKPSGAHTGDLSAEMLADAGARLRHRRP